MYCAVSFSIKSRRIVAVDLLIIVVYKSESSGIVTGIIGLDVFHRANERIEVDSLGAKVIHSFSGDDWRALTVRHEAAHIRYVRGSVLMGLEF